MDQLTKKHQSENKLLKNSDQSILGKHVAILVTDNVALFELGCAVELFSLPRPEIDNWYKTDVISFSDEPLKATGGITLTALTVNSLNAYDMLVVPSWPLEQAVPKNLMNEVLSLHKRGGKIISFCSGAFLLGEVGLLDGRDAITHWRYAEEFKHRFKRVNYVDDVLYIHDQQIGCSAGSSAAIDLGIAIIRSDFGYQVANQVARRLVLAAHRNGGQSQFVESPILKKADHFSSTLDWALENISRRIDVASLAEKANTSRRTFDRQFRKSLNMSPKEWLIQQRLIRAKQLLETTSQNIDLVAANSGFETAMSLRHHFRKHSQLSPSQFRHQFSDQK